MPNWYTGNGQTSGGSGRYIAHSSTDYHTINYNGLDRNITNASKALKGFLTQKGYDNNFMRRISTVQFSRFASEFARSQKTVERLLVDHDLYNPLGIRASDLDEQRNQALRENQEVRTRDYGRLTVDSIEPLGIDRDAYDRFMAQYLQRNERPTRVVMPTSPQRRRRSESDMLLSVIKGDDFPKPQFVNWQSQRELSQIIDDWYQNVEYKDQWIFSRREREGFNRRNIGHFSLEEVQQKISKSKTSKTAYDWKFGGTDWVLRLELVEVDKEEHGLINYLICRYIHKPTNKEVKYDVRYWTGSKFNSLLNLWTQWQDNERMVSSHLADLPDYEDEQGEQIEEEEMFNPFSVAQHERVSSYSYNPSVEFYSTPYDDSDDEIEDFDEEEYDEGDTF